MEPKHVFPDPFQPGAAPALAPTRQTEKEPEVEPVQEPVEEHAELEESAPATEPEPAIVQRAEDADPAPPTAAELTADTDPTVQVDPPAQEQPEAGTGTGAEGETPTDSEPGPEFYDRRRRRWIRGGLAGAAAVAVGLWWLTPGGDDPATPQQAAPAAQPAVVAEGATVPGAASALNADLQALAASAGTGFTGATVPGAKVAAAGSTVFVARVTPEGCLVGGIVDGQTKQAELDPTGQGCTDAAIAQVQQALDEAEAQRSAAAAHEADQALTDAADAALFHASRNFENGQPSFSGLDSSWLAPATVGFFASDELTLEYRDGPVCRYLTVNTDGYVSDIKSC
jgi:hypothetical protein